MSAVTEALLSFRELDDLPVMPVVEVNKTLNEGARAWRQQKFRRLDHRNDVYGGFKGMQIPLYAAAFSNIPTSEILAALARAEWEEPKSVQLIVHEEEALQWELLFIEDFQRIRERDAQGRWAHVYEKGGEK